MKTPPIRIAENIPCLAASNFADGYFAYWWSRQKKTPISVHNALTGETTLRKCVLVSVDEDPYWVDYITGTMYDAETGRCMSSLYRRAEIPSQISH